MENIIIIEENFGPFGNPDLIAQAHIVIDGEHFLASTSNAFRRGIETLVFSCDESGKITDWIEVAGEQYNGLNLKDGTKNVVSFLMEEERNMWRSHG